MGEHTKTPRTDAAILNASIPALHKEDVIVVYADFARRLERENAELVAALRWMADSLNWYHDGEETVVKRMDYAGAKVGIFLYSWGLKPWIFAETELAKSGAYRFDKTFCSQCGGEFGPNNHGYSHCENHSKAALDKRGAR